MKLIKLYAYIAAMACGGVIAVTSHDAVAGVELIAGTGIVIETITTICAQTKRRIDAQLEIDRALEGTTRLCPSVKPTVTSGYSIFQIGSIEIAGLASQSFAKDLIREIKRCKPDTAVGICNDGVMIGILIIFNPVSGFADTSAAEAKMFLNTLADREAAERASRTYLDDIQGLNGASIEFCNCKQTRKHRSLTSVVNRNCRQGRPSGSFCLL